MSRFLSLQDLWVFCVPFLLSSIVAVNSKAISSPTSDGPAPASDLPCMNEKGILVTHGEKYRMSECSNCSCNNATLTCQFESCPNLTCTNRIKVDGQCCETCQRTSDGPAPASDLPCMSEKGRIVTHGERYRVSECSICSCNNATLTCQFESCPNLTCTSRIKVDGQCCETCQQTSDDPAPASDLPCMNEKGRIVTHGERYRLSECSFCSCDNSTLTCQFQSCLTLTCTNRIKVDGQCCETCQQTSDDPPPASELPCINNEGRLVIHGERYQLAECTYCSCDNATLSCHIVSCPILTCTNRVTLTGSCCDACDYRVTVTDVSPLVHPNTEIKVGTQNEITLDLDVMYVFDREATSIAGQGLWSTRLWMAQHEDGTGELSGTITAEALTKGQQSQDLKKRQDRTFSIEDIRYRFDLTDHTCDEAKFICAQFNKGPKAEMEADYLKFHFDAQPSMNVLTGCIENTFCYGEGTVRLAGGSDAHRGRVEIYHDDSWGAVCDANWDSQDANTVCRQLGFLDATDATRGSFFGATELPTVMDRVACKGTEPHLFDCAFVCSESRWCNSTAGVVCKPNNIRLVGGADHTMGRVELFQQGNWGSICDDDWDMNDAGVVCRYLGFSGAKKAKTGSHFGGSDGPYLMQGVRCEGSEAAITDCPSHCWDEPKCNSTSTAGVVCQEM